MGLGIMTRIRFLFRRMMTSHNVNFKMPVSFTGRLHFSGQGSVFLGERTRNRGEVWIESVRKSSQILIGCNTFFNRNDMIVCRNRIIIGDDCMFGPNVCIYDHDHMYTKERVHPYDYIDKEVIIGNNVWCGANVVILGGVEIGDGAVIGAGTVVKGNVPPHTLVYPSNKLVIHPITNEKRVEILV